MSQKHVLILTINFPPNPSVGTRRVSKILKYIDYRKFKISVLTLKEEYYNARLGKLMGNEAKIPPSVQVYRTDRADLTRVFTEIKRWAKKLLGKKESHSSKTPKSGSVAKAEHTSVSKKPSFLSTAVNKVRDFVFFFFEFPDKYIGWLPYALREGLRIVRSQQVDVIFTTAPPHSVFLMALILKKMSGKQLVLDFRDPWAISRWDRGNPVRYGLERIIEKICISSADLVFFVTEKMRDEYARLYGAKVSHKFKVFYNGFDPEDFPEQKATAQKKQSKGPRRFVHLGTLYKRRNPVPLFLAIKQLHDQGKISPEKARFEFIGSVFSELSFIQSKIDELGIREYITFTPPISFDQSIATMYAADVLLLIQPDTDLQIPAKLFEYIYTQKPILAIAEENSATHQVLRESGLGILAPTKKIDAIAEAIETLMNNPQRFKSTQEFIDRFNYQKYIKTFERFLNGI